MKPKVFIGSSKASLPVVRELERKLGQCCEITAWDSKGLFGAGDIILDRLIELSGKFDFAILVFGFDDFLAGGDVAVPRDNVLFELGLFMSRLGRTRTFAVVPEMADKKVKILSDLGGLITLRYHATDSPELLPALLGPAVDELLAKVGSPISAQTINVDDATHPDVQSLLGALGEVVKKKMSASKPVKICNLALDMETTWTYLRDRYLHEITASGINWKSLMIDPDAPAIRALQSFTVSTTIASARIDEMQRFLRAEHSTLQDRGLHVQVKAYASIPVMHGFLVDDEILFLSFCGIRQVPSAKRPGQFVNELIGAPTAYWKFEKSSTNPAAHHFVSAFSGWFEFLWKSGRAIWPQPGMKRER